MLNNLLIGLISGIIAGSIVYYSTLYFKKLKNKKIYEQSIDNIVRISLYNLEKFHYILVDLKELLASNYSKQNFDKVNIDLNMIDNSIGPENEFSLDNSMKYLESIKELLISQNKTENYTNMIRNEVKVEMRLNSLRKNINILLKNNLPKNYIQVNDCFKNKSTTLINQYRQINSDIKDLCTVLEVRVALLLNSIKERMLLQDVITYCIWPNDNPISCEELINRMKKIFDLKSDKSQIESKLNELVESNKISMKEDKYMKNGSGTALSTGIKTCKIQVNYNAKSKNRLL